MRVLMVLGSGLVAKDFDKIGVSMIGTSLLRVRKGEYDLLANDPDGVTKGYVRKLYHVDKTRDHGKQTYLRMRKILSKGKHDVVNVQLTFMGFVDYVNRLADEFPTVRWAVSHRAPPEGSTDLKFRARDHYLKFLHDPKIRSIFVSQNHKDRFLKYFKELSKKHRKRCHVVWNGIVFDDGEKIPKKKKKYDMVVIGRLDMFKRIVETLEVALEACDGKILYIGDDSQSCSTRYNKWDQYLERYAALRKENKGRLVCAGAVSNFDVLHKLLPKCRVHFLLSPQETFCNPIVEAARCKVPSIVPDSGGPQEIVPVLKVGTVVQVKNRRFDTRVKLVREAYDELLPLSSQERKRLFRNAKKLFSAESMASGYEEIFNVLVS